MSEAKQTGLMSWDDPAFNRGSKPKIDYLRLKGGNSYQVRLFHHPIHVIRIYNEKNNRSIIIDPNEVNNHPVKIKYPEMKPKDRFAILVIDRADGKVKVMEGPEVVFKAFRNFYQKVGIDPGGPEGTDWSITVTGSGVKTRYEVTNLMKSTPFKEEETKQIRQKIEQEGYELTKLFKPTDISVSEKILFGEAEEEGQDAPASQANASAGKDKELAF